MSTALVLGGGGVTGIAWEVGVLHGLSAGPDRLRAVAIAPDLVVGTSAGSVVGAHVAAGTDIDGLYAAQSRPAPAELSSSVDLAQLSAVFAERVEGAADPVEARRRIGQLAREFGHDQILEARRAAVVARLPGPAWPHRPLLVTAVDVDSGAVVVLDAASGVPLADAVAASCAVPGVWPVVRAGGRTLMDGGVAALAHVDLAAGHELVVVLAPVPSPASASNPGLDTQVANLRATGAEVWVIGPDADYLAGPGVAVFDPNARGASAAAGQRFGRAFAENLH